MRDTLNALATVGLIALVIVGWNQWIGLTLILEKPDPDYLAMAHFARDNTPLDAIFVVPPGESDFRLESRRAVVVNFKAVPQLGSELTEWAQRFARCAGPARPGCATSPRFR